MRGRWIRRRGGGGRGNEAYHPAVELLESRSCRCLNRATQPQEAFPHRRSAENSQEAGQTQPSDNATLMRG